MTEHLRLSHPRRAVHPPDPLDLARWAEARLHDSLDDRVDVHDASARLYGLEVIDAAALRDGGPAPAARLSFLADARRADALTIGAATADACRFDGAVLVTGRWEQPAWPSPGPARPITPRWVRLVVVVADGGVATARRAERVVLARGVGCGGAAAVRLVAAWRDARRGRESCARWS